MSEYIIYIIPAMVCLVIKLWMVVLCKQALKQDAFTGVVTTCLMLTVCEIALFYLYWTGYSVEYLFRTFYVILIFWLSFSLTYVIQTFTKKSAGKSIYFLAGLLSALILFTDLIISGYQTIDYSITGVRENLYFLYQLFVFSSILTAITILAVQLKRQASVKIKIQALSLIVAFSIPFAVIVGVTTLMLLNYKVNMAIVFSIATTLFLFFTVNAHKQHQISDIRKWIPWSKENVATNEIMETITEYLADEKSLKEVESTIKKTLIEYKLKSCDNNIQQTAKKLQIPRSTLYSIMKKLDKS